MGRNSKSRKVITRSESGTCNVCSAPCSSCLHINKGLRSVKAEESSGETCQENIESQSSVIDAPVRMCDSGMQAASETSNSKPGCDKNFKESESRSDVKSCDVSKASGDVGKPTTSSPDGNVERLCDKIAVKREEQKGVESRVESTSCVTGGSEANRLASSYNKSVELQRGLDELSSPKKELFESSSEDKNEGAQSSKLPNILSHSSSGKFVSCDSNVKEPKDSLVSKEHLGSSLMKEATSQLGPAEVAIDHCINVEEASLGVEGEKNPDSSAASQEVGSKSESKALADSNTENLPNKADNPLAQNIETEKESCELAGLQEISMKSQPMIDSEESEALEHDVKVCDICGDAGLEDLLAICSRCSDGAEHTYCMREMISKVPEGDWLCEECKALDKIKSKDAVTMSGSDRHQSSEGASVEDTDFFSNIDRKELDAEETKPRKRILGKRFADNRPKEDIETSPIAKRQALGSTVESPKGANKAAYLSRDSSSKSLNKGESKSHHNSNSEALEDPSPLRGLRHQEARSSLSKSSSFSTNPKSKSDFFSESSQKHKTGRESADIDRKEGSSKYIGRSTSFKPPSSSRLNHSESKVKMLSPKFSHSQDVKGIRQGKAQNILERKGSFKPEHSSTVSAASSDQKLPRNDPSISSNNESKGVQSDRKPSTISKSTSFMARKGEMKNNSVLDQRRKEASLLDDSSNSRGGIPASSSRSQETERVGDRTRDRSVSRCRTEIVNDASAARSSADVQKGNKLKAAIEAAMLKKPGICRKKPADQSDEVSVPSSNLNSETRPEDPLSTSSKRGNVSSSYEAHEKQATSMNGDQSSLPMGTAYSKSGDNCPVVPFGLKDHPSMAVSIFSKTPVLPEHEYIWQGGFDIRKIGKLADLRDGVQAHLSTCASPKVFEVVNKFPSKVLLNEVPRSSTWPLQFQEAGVKEDNIALYFFAKDIESYERSYKFLLENMMRRDLALKGNFDGVELLIFPSNHLPRNAQRWNMLYFLWGVFRGKKPVSVQNVSNSNACNASQASDSPVKVNLPVLDRNVAADSTKHVSLEMEGLTSDNVKVVCGAQVSLGDSNGQYGQEETEKLSPKVDGKRVGDISESDTKTTNPLEEKVEPKAKNKPDVAKVQLSVQDAQTNAPPNTRYSSYTPGASARASLSDDLANLERTVKEEGSPEASLVRESPMEVDIATTESKESQFSKKRLNEDPEGESANKKQKIEFPVAASAGRDMFAKVFPTSEQGLEGENKAPKRGFILDLNEAQDYSPDGPSPAAKQEKGGFFDLNVAQDEEGDDPSLLSLSLPFPLLSKEEPEVKPAMSKMEPFLQGRPNTRSSQLFFDGLSKK